MNGEGFGGGKTQGQDSRVGGNIQQRDCVKGLLGSVPWGSHLYGAVTWAADRDSGRGPVRRAFQWRTPVSREAFKGRQARRDLFVSTRGKVPFRGVGNICPNVCLLNCSRLRERKNYDGLTWTFLVLLSFTPTCLKPQQLYFWWPDSQRPQL